MADRFGWLRARARGLPVQGITGRLPILCVMAVAVGAVTRPAPARAQGQGGAQVQPPPVNFKGPAEKFPGSPLPEAPARAPNTEAPPAAAEQPPAQQPSPPKWPGGPLRPASASDSPSGPSVVTSPDA